jgi:hypothetical protein
MAITKELYREITRARKSINDSDKGLEEIMAKILLNLEFEKAGQPLPYDYVALHSEAEAYREEKIVAPTRLSDEAAIIVPVMFPTLKRDGALIKAGSRINWNGVLKRATVDLWDREDSDPKNAPALWEDVVYSDGIREIPGIITVTSAFSKGELGKWNGVVYESLIDANVWTPTQYPAGWQVKE